MARNWLRNVNCRRAKTLSLMLLAAVVLGWALAAEAANPIPKAERDILLALYSATNGDSWDFNEGWGDVSGTECTWQGITCTLQGDEATGTYHVTSINLGSNNLSGSIPAQLGGLTTL